MTLRYVLNYLYKFLILGVSFYGLYLTLSSSVDAIETLSYFTTQVNVLVFLSYFYYLIRLTFFKKKQRRNVFVKQGLLVYGLITTIVYSFLLIPYILNNQIDYEVGSLKDIILHYVVPFALFVDYGLFDLKGKFRRRNLPLLLGYPIVYLGYIYAFVYFGGRFDLGGGSIFPYYFLDYETYGILTTSLMTGGIFFLILFLGWLTYIVDDIVKHQLIYKK
jgi:hypothetical protein